jgi:DNA-binding NarL/FixJ family response regulator
MLRMGVWALGGTAVRGRCRYTVRQSQILMLAAAGLSDKQIAIHLALSVSTVRAHIQRFYRANGAKNRAAAVAMWVRNQVSVEGNSGPA